MPMRKLPPPIHPKFQNSLIKSQKEINKGYNMAKKINIGAEGETPIKVGWRNRRLM
jgi:hypothetical protein